MKYKAPNTNSKGTPQEVAMAIDDDLLFLINKLHIMADVLVEKSGRLLEEAKKL